MNQTVIRTNKVFSINLQYSNYVSMNINQVYTYIDGNQFSGKDSDSQYLLPYQIETNKAFQHYLEWSNNIENFRIAIQLEENYQTIMNLFVVSLINRNFEDFESLLSKAMTHAAPEETHHIILLIEYYLLIHDYDNALKHLIFLLNNQKLHNGVENLLKEVCSHKLFSRQHISNLVSDNNLLEQIIKLNKHSFVQYHSTISQQEFQSKHTQGSKLNLSHQHSKEQQISFIQDKSNQTQSDKTQQTDQLSFISQNPLNFSINQSQLDFIFIDTIIEYPNLFSFSNQIPYMIGSYDIRKINKLSSKIAEGGYGEVFLAKHLQTNEIHALKVIKQQEDQQVEVVLQEIIIQDKIQQLNPQLFLNLKPLVYIMKDSILTDIYIPLELGQFSLYDYILQHQINEIEYNQFYNLFIDFIVTLHKHKYAHRDIKPQNILYIKDQGWKLADFGESLKYIDSEDVYKFKGTYAFLPQNLRKNHKQQRQVIKQNLLYNDVYAAVCTLVLIKNPNFNSKQLTEYMDNNQYDLQLQKLQNNFKDFELIKELKINQIQYVETKPIQLKQIQDQEDLMTYLAYLHYHSNLSQQLNDEFIQKLDEKLFTLPNKQYLSIMISKDFPFQIEQFTNIVKFNFNRLKFASDKIRNKHDIYSLRYIIQFLLQMEFYDYAIIVIENYNHKEYDNQLQLFKIQALMCQDRQSEAKDELLLVSRYLLSVQSYSLQEQIQFCQLYNLLHKEMPQIKLDEKIKKQIINDKCSLNEAQTVYNLKRDIKLVDEKIHLKLRLDVLFDFVHINSYACEVFSSEKQSKVIEYYIEKTIKMFGENFLQNQQLANYDCLITLIKENLVFWGYLYQTKTHIIGIGLNYILKYFGLYHAALDIGVYFHTILKNVGSCENIIAHYEHLLETEIDIYNYYGQKPKIYIDSREMWQEVQYLSLFDQIFINLKSEIIQLKISIRVEQTDFNHKERYQIGKILISILNSISTIVESNQLNQGQTKRLIDYLIHMNRELSKLVNMQRVYILQVIKKGIKMLFNLNRIQHTQVYILALSETRQFKQNYQNIKQWNIIDDGLVLQLTNSKIFYPTLLNIVQSPMRVVNKLEKHFGLDHKISLVQSLDYKRNCELGHFLYCKAQLTSTRKTNATMKVIGNIKKKIDQINLRHQYMMNL